MRTRSLRGERRQDVEDEEIIPALSEDGKA